MDPRPSRMHRYILVCIIHTCLVICGYVFFTSTYIVERAPTGVTLTNTNRAKRAVSSVTLTNANSIQMVETFHNDWIPVSPTVLLYSAYTDSNVEPGVVRMIGLKERATRGGYTCVFFNESAQQVAQTPANISIIPDHHDMKWSAYFILCRLNKGPLPLYVSLKQGYKKGVKVTSGTDKKVRLIPIHPRNISYNFVVCVAPLHDNIVPDRLVVWLELNLMLGVNHFIIYNYNASQEVVQILRHYRSRGHLEILAWSMDKPTVNKTHYFGQMAAVNDCIYRSRAVGKYVGIFDLDEVIMPQDASDVTWMDMLKRSPQENNTAFMFRNNFFPHTGNLTALSMANSTVRCKEISDPRTRSKVIVMPDYVQTMGIHLVHKFINAKKAYVVSHRHGLLHHYRFETPPCNLTTVSGELKAAMNSRARELEKRLKAPFLKHLFDT